MQLAIVRNQYFGKLSVEHPDIIQQLVKIVASRHRFSTVEQPLPHRRYLWLQY